MPSRLILAAVAAALAVCNPACADEDPAAPVREVMRLVMWTIAAGGRDAADGPFTTAALDAHYTKSFAALYGAARAAVKGEAAPFDRDPILDGKAACPLKDITLTPISPGAFHARIKVEFRSAWCEVPFDDAAPRDRLTTTFFEVYNENEWRVDDIRREDFSFRDGLTAAAPDGGKPAAPETVAADDSKSCIKDESGFKQNGKAATFEVTLINTCPRPMRCTVNAYIVTANGPTSGKSVLMLPGKSKRAAAKKTTYAIPVKTAGGMANVSRDCKPV